MIFDATNRDNFYVEFAGKSDAVRKEASSHGRIQNACPTLGSEHRVNTIRNMAVGHEPEVREVKQRTLCSKSHGAVNRLSSSGLWLFLPPTPALACRAHICRRFATSKSQTQLVSRGEEIR